MFTQQHRHQKTSGRENAQKHNTELLGKHANNKTETVGNVNLEEYLERYRLADDLIPETDRHSCETDKDTFDDHHQNDDHCQCADFFLSFFVACLRYFRGFIFSFVHTEIRRRFQLCSVDSSVDCVFMIESDDSGEKWMDYSNVLDDFVGENLRLDRLRLDMITIAITWYFRVCSCGCVCLWFPELKMTNMSEDADGTIVHLSIFLQRNITKNMDGMMIV